MALRVLRILCVVIGHRRSAKTRRNENGSVFADCALCGTTLYREPVRGKWRAATPVDLQPRGFALTEEREQVLAPTKKRSQRR